MKRAPRSRQRHDLYAKYHDYDSEISDLLGECGIEDRRQETESMKEEARNGMDAVAAQALCAILRPSPAERVLDVLPVHDHWGVRPELRRCRPRLRNVGAEGGPSSEEH